MAKERVQKILAKAGICSRRKAEEMIVEGLVTINGKRAQLGDQATWGEDSIKVSGKLLLQQETPTYLAYFKPKGVICALSDPQGRPTLALHLKKLTHRVYPIGRLDFNSEGIVLLTNDGDFAEKIQRKEDIPRVYAVKVKGHPTEEMISRLKRGAKLGHEVKRLFKPHEVWVKQELANKALVQLVVMGSGAFDLRAYFELKGFLVEKISRTSFGHLTLRGLEPGHYRLLKQSQAYALLEQPELGMKVIEKPIQPKAQTQATRMTPVARPAAASRIAPRSLPRPVTGKPAQRITPNTYGAVGARPNPSGKTPRTGRAAPQSGPRSTSRTTSKPALRAKPASSSRKRIKPV